MTLDEVLSQEVEAATVTATGTLVAYGARLRGVHVATSGTAGSVELRDGGSSGTLKLDLPISANAEDHYIPIPDNGIAFGADIHATLSNADGVTVFYR